MLAGLVEVLAQLGARARAPARALPLRHQLDELLVAARTDDETPGDRRHLVNRAAAALDALDAPPSAGPSGIALRKG